MARLDSTEPARQSENLRPVTLSAFVRREQRQAGIATRQRTATRDLLPTYVDDVQTVKTGRASIDTLGFGPMLSDASAPGKLDVLRSSIACDPTDVLP